MPAHPIRKIESLVGKERGRGTIYGLRLIHRAMEEVGTANDFPALAGKDPHEQLEFLYGLGEAVQGRPPAGASQPEIKANVMSFFSNLDPQIQELGYRMWKILRGFSAAPIRDDAHFAHGEDGDGMLGVDRKTSTDRGVYLKLLLHIANIATKADYEEYIRGNAIKMRQLLKPFELAATTGQLDLNHASLPDEVKIADPSLLIEGLGLNRDRIGGGGGLTADDVENAKINAALKRLAKEAGHTLAVVDTPGIIAELRGNVPFLSNTSVLPDAAGLTHGAAEEAIDKVKKLNALQKLAEAAGIDITTRVGGGALQLGSDTALQDITEKLREHNAITDTNLPDDATPDQILSLNRGIVGHIQKMSTISSVIRTLASLGVPLGVMPNPRINPDGAYNHLIDVLNRHPADKAGNPNLTVGSSQVDVQTRLEQIGAHSRAAGGDSAAVNQAVKEQLETRLQALIGLNAIINPLKQHSKKARELDTAYSGHLLNLQQRKVNDIDMLDLAATDPAVFKAAVDSVLTGVDGVEARISHYQEEIRKLRKHVNDERVKTRSLFKILKRLGIDGVTNGFGAYDLPNIQSLQRVLTHNETVANRDAILQKIVEEANNALAARGIGGNPLSINADGFIDKNPQQMSALEERLVGKHLEKKTRVLGRIDRLIRLKQLVGDPRFSNIAAKQGDIDALDHEMEDNFQDHIDTHIGAIDDIADETDLDTRIGELEKIQGLQKLAETVGIPISGIDLRDPNALQDIVVALRAHDAIDDVALPDALTLTPVHIETCLATVRGHKLARRTEAKDALERVLTEMHSQVTTAAAPIDANYTTAKTNAETALAGVDPDQEHDFQEKMRAAAQRIQEFSRHVARLLPGGGPLPPELSRQIDSIGEIIGGLSHAAYPGAGTPIERLTWIEKRTRVIEENLKPPEPHWFYGKPRFKRRA